MEGTVIPEFPSGYAGGTTVRSHGATAGASSLATTITAGGTANTKGSYVELIASTEFDANWILITFSHASATFPSHLTDIAIGAATEQVIIPDLFCVMRTNGSYPSYLIPVFIPKGSRLTARCQSNSISATIRIAITLISGSALSGGSGPSMVSAYGAVASSTGTLVDPGAVADTDSAWVEISASTDRDHHWLIIAGHFGDTVLAAVLAWRLSVGIGAATEQVLIPNLHLAAEIASDGPYSPVFCLPCFIPKGSRLTVRMRCSVTTAGDRAANIKLYGAG